LREATNVVLLALAADRASEGDSESGRHVFKGSEVAETTTLSPGEINDAVELLEQDDLVKVVRTMGNAPFDFGYVELTASGRLVAEEVHEGTYEKADSQPPTEIRRVFITHAASDRQIAEYVRDVLKELKPGIEVFVASRPGLIQSGEEWWARIKAELRAADAYIVLLTPQSVERLWVAFESGAAWMAKRPMLTVSAGGLNRAEVPMPLAVFQITSLQETEEVVAAFGRWGLKLSDPTAFAAHVRELTEHGTFIESEGWQGVEVQNRYFAWDGPRLHKLDDRSPIPAPPMVIEAMKEVGVTPSFGRLDKLRTHLAKGAMQVYETDRKSWRRELLYSDDGSQVLLASATDTEPIQ
jgi:hypothetical protein